jgi:uncharacterized cupin superfamily protein
MLWMSLAWSMEEEMVVVVEGEGAWGVLVDIFDVW